MFDSIPNQTIPCTLYQHRYFADALRACGRDPVMIEGAVPLLALKRKFRSGLKVVMLARAWLDVPELLADRLKQAGLHRHLILLSPDQPTPDLRLIGAVPLMTPATVGEIDLAQPQEIRRATLHQKWRNRLVFAEKQGLRITRQNMSARPGHWLMQAEAVQQRRAGYRTWPEALTLAYGRENPGAAKLFTAFEGRIPVAAMLFLRHGSRATYHIGHTTARGRALSAHNLLLWQASCWLAVKGHRRLDLGVIDTQHGPGLARFKLGAGAKPRLLGGTWGWWPVLGQTLRPLAGLDPMGRFGNWTGAP